VRELLIAAHARGVERGITRLDHHWGRQDERIRNGSAMSRHALWPQSEESLSAAFDAGLKKFQHAPPGIEAGLGIGLRGATHIEQFSGSALYS
jgi:hypothetical protein